MIKIEKSHIELKLLAGIPIEIKNLGTLYSPKLKEIAHIGNTRYNQHLGLCIYSIKDAIEGLNGNKEFQDVEKQLKEIHSFDLIISQCIHSKAFLSMFLDALGFFLKAKITPVFSNHDPYFIVGDIENRNNLNTINRRNFEVMQKIIKWQNGVDEQEKNAYKPANQKAKEIAEKIKKAKEKINKLKNSKNEELTLFDLISVFAYYANGYNLNNVWDMDIFMFNDQFKRMQFIEEYNLNIQSLLHGADPNKIELKNLVTKIN